MGRRTVGIIPLPKGRNDERHYLRERHDGPANAREHRPALA